MKKLFRNTVLFLLPLSVALVFLPVDKRMKYQGLQDDCFDHGLWIHDRIFRNDTPIDIAFLGSSHTINGIDDKQLSKQLKKEVVNLGYCRLGRNLTKLLLQDITEKKHLKKVVIEVCEYEDRYSHPVFPHLASTKDVLLPHVLFNRDIGADIWAHFSYKLELTQEAFFRTEKAPIRTQNYGYAPHLDTAKGQDLELARTNRQSNPKQLSPCAKDFYHAFPKRYLSDIRKICKAKNIELIFLYLPSFGSPEKVPNELAYYKKLGKVLLPPKHILENPNYWHDDNHLNITGGSKLSYWLEKELH